MRGQPVEGSISKRIGIHRSVNQGIFVPRAPTVNESLQLEEGKSPIYFIEVRGKSGRHYNLGGFTDLEVNLVNGDVYANLYHFLIAMGYGVITEPTSPAFASTFAHDLIDHVPGLYLMAFTPAWSKLRTLLAEAIYVEATHGLQTRAFREAAQMRFYLGKSIEESSSIITLEERLGDDTTAKLILFSQEIDRRFNYWQLLKSQETLAIPENPLRYTPWWEKVLKLLPGLSARFSRQ